MQMKLMRTEVSLMRQMINIELQSVWNTLVIVHAQHMTLCYHIWPSMLAMALQVYPGFETST